MTVPAIALSASPLPCPDVSADWLVACVWEAEAFGPDLSALDQRLGGQLARLRDGNDLTGKHLEIVPLYTPTGVAARRVLLVGLGRRTAFDRVALHAASACAARSITGKAVERVAFALPDDPPALGPSDCILAAGTGFLSGCQGPGIRKSEQARFAPQEVVLLTDRAASAESAVRRTGAEARGVALARELVNMPPCELYPDTFAVRAMEEASPKGVECEVLEEEDLIAGRMGAILGVAHGSERPPRLVVMRYRNAPDKPTLGLVGKGVTFDSGGLSLKTNEQMLDMKCDMAGAAAVLAATLAVAELRLPVNLLAVLPLVENMPGGRAMRLGDVLFSRSGKTIEVLNTDAEGRLILADALSYAVGQNADHLVDLATLTGACMVALGTEVAGLMSNNAAWGDRVLSACRQAGERAWPLPMDAHYGELIRSNVADVKNAPGTRYGGAISAAKFLEQFVGDVPWAHLDIAGPAWAEHESAARDAGGTGYGVRALVELAHRYGDSSG
jgi:leucyl aminopeptidase